MKGNIVTTAIAIPPERQDFGQIMLYKFWLAKNLNTLAAGATTYKFSSNKIIFLHAEDAVAFRLRFDI